MDQENNELKVVKTPDGELGVKDAEGNVTTEKGTTPAKKKKPDLRVIQNQANEFVCVDANDPQRELTKAEQKKAKKMIDKKVKEVAEEQAKAMEGQIVRMGEAVKSALCNTCVHCRNPNKDFDRFKITSSRGNELFTPMNYCTKSALSMVDVKTCEIYQEDKEKRTTPKEG